MNRSRPVSKYLAPWWVKNMYNQGFLNKNKWSVFFQLISNLAGVIIGWVLRNFSIFGPVAKCLPATICMWTIIECTVFFKTRGHLLVWAPPCLASSGLVWPCLAMPCHVSCCLAWIRTWRFFVNYQKRDSYSRVVLLCIFNFSINRVFTADNNMGKI